jgi:hypothetical protein
MLTRLPSPVRGRGAGGEGGQRLFAVSNRRVAPKALLSVSRKQQEAMLQRLPLAHAASIVRTDYARPVPSAPR